jgi:hypothetical protein
LLGLEEVAHHALDLVGREAMEIELSDDGRVEEGVARVEAGRLGAAAGHGARIAAGASNG